MVVASFIVEQVHPIIRCDRAAIAIIVEVDEFFFDYSIENVEEPLLLGAGFPS
jgi:hypothetical protein